MMWNAVELPSAGSVSEADGSDSDALNAAPQAQITNPKAQMSDSLSS